MERNLGTLDKIIRGIVGLGLVFVSANNFIGSGFVSGILFIVGLVLIFESMFGFCFLYKIFGINTNKRNESEGEVPPQA